MKQASAFAPANISLFFSISDHKNPRWRGSYGCGFTLKEGVTVTVKETKKTAILFNKKKILFPPVAAIIQKLTNKPVRVEITSELALGCGFGISGASTLATAYAINKLLHLKKSKKQLVILSHTAEVESGTGLGDVANQYFGGVLAKFVPSSRFIVKKIDMSGIPVYWTSISKLSTKSVITNAEKKEHINSAGNVALEKLKKLMERKSLSLSEIFTIAKEFAENSGLLENTKVRKTIEQIEKTSGHASMIILGNAVISDMPFAGSRKTYISNNPARLL